MGNANPNTFIRYQIQIANNGPDDATGALISDYFSPTPSVVAVSYTAFSSSNATGFTVSGTGLINDTVNMPAGSTITYLVSAYISVADIHYLNFSATVTPPSGDTLAPTSVTQAADWDSIF